VKPRFYRLRHIFAAAPAEERKAYYHFAIKGNQSQLLENIGFFHFQGRKAPGFAARSTLTMDASKPARSGLPRHLTATLTSPTQVELSSPNAKPSKNRRHGIPPNRLRHHQSNARADAQRVVQHNGAHWSILGYGYRLDWNCDKDRSRIRSRHGPRNITRLWRFAIDGPNPKASIASPSKMRELILKVRLVFDYLHITLLRRLSVAKNLVIERPPPPKRPSPALRLSHAFPRW
jgi:hypothetical protein